MMNLDLFRKRFIAKYNKERGWITYITFHFKDAEDYEEQIYKIVRANTPEDAYINITVEGNKIGVEVRGD